MPSPPRSFSSEVVHSRHSPTVSAVPSAMLRSPIVTARASGFKRLPLQTGHGRSLMYRSMSARMKSEVVSRYCRSSQGRTPSHSYSYERRCPFRFSYVSFSASSVPFKIASTAFFDSDLIGVSSENLNLRASPSRIAMRYWAVPLDFCHGRTAPSLSERSGLPSTRSGSGSSFVPSPVHGGHAPWGELNENVRGSISPIEKSPSGQASRSENRRSGPLPSASATSARPSPR